MAFNCRENCGACCVAPSIHTGFYGMPAGKKAGEACVHLDERMKCSIFDRPERPAFCASLPPSEEMCMGSREGALDYLSQLEVLTQPE